MRITRWGEYGILCSLYLAKRFESGPVGASEIAEGQQIPTQYAQQILHRLRKGGIITSVRGPRGGFMLSKSPQELNLREVLHAAEGQTFEIICESDPIFPNESGSETAAEPAAQSCCNSSATSNGCALKNVWHELQSTINTMLESKTLASLLEQESALSDGTTQVGFENKLVEGPKSSKNKQTLVSETLTS